MNILNYEAQEVSSLQEIIEKHKKIRTALKER